MATAEALRLAQKANSLAPGASLASRSRQGRAALLESRVAESPARAAELASGVVEMVDALPPALPVLLADALQQYGSATCQAGEHEAGRAALERAQALREKYEHPDSPRTAETRVALDACRGDKSPQRR